MSGTLSRWLVTLVGTLLLAALLWLFGPLWPPLEPALPRILALQTLLLAWAAANATLDWRRRKQDASLATGLSAGEERSAMGEAFARALAGARGGRAALRELPWYAIIGPPGAGKTTALLNAGLTFTAGTEGGRVAGVGGTRMCDWWFTDRAVLIDTAGRYTTQDSDAEVDRAGWDAFLGLLRRTRPERPLNGVLVAIGLPDLVGASEPERAAHAAAVARRIAELERRLGLSLPVYALFTKADLVQGFTEFFDDLDRDGRNQVWGETFPLAAPTPLPDRFAGAFRTLATRLSARMIPRLAAELRPERRGPIAGFPTQFASLEKPLAAFIAGAFGATPMLRGIYFASGTQEGTPIDRLTGAMARAFGIQPGRAAALRPEAGRSYFLTDLLNRVIFNEATLVGDRPGRRRTRTLLRGAAFTILAIAAIGAAGTVLWAARRATAQVDTAATALSAYEQAATPLAADPVADADLRPLDAALAQARALADAVPETDPGLGLGQSAKLEAGARSAYRDALVYGLLPRLLWQLEAAMRGQLRTPDRLYDTTRLYLMLGGAGPLDASPLRARMAADWAQAYPDDPALVADMLGHLDRLLAQPLPPVPLDGPLVEAARAAFGSVPVPDRIFANLRGATASLPPWRPIDPLGAAGVPIFARASGRPMTEGIPGLFTAGGYRDVLVPSLAAAARQVAAETWVTGRKAEYTPTELQALEQAVLTLYLAEFDRQWDALLADIDIAPLASLPQAAQALYIVASPESPMRALLRSIAVQLALPPGSPQVAAATARYAGLVALMAGDGAQLDRSLRLVADIQQVLAKIAALPVGTAAPTGGDDIGNALAADALRQPAPLGRWLNTISATAQALRTGNARRRIALAFAAPGGPAQSCAAATAKYPFTPTAPAMDIAEFARVFGPGGVLDAFFNTQIKPFVDTGSKPWKPQPASGTAPPLTQADAAAFQRAAAIRDALFPANQPSPALPVELAPLPSGPPATLDVGGTAIETGSGSTAHAAQFTWPGPGGASLKPQPPAAAIDESGPWALFRLFARARIVPVPRSTKQLLAFGTGPAAPSFELHTSPAPFTPGFFTDFRCPAAPSATP